MVFNKPATIIHKTKVFTGKNFILLSRQGLWVFGCYQDSLTMSCSSSWSRCLGLVYLFILKSISFFLVASPKILCLSIFHFKGVLEITFPSGETTLISGHFLSSTSFSYREGSISLVDRDDVDNLMVFSQIVYLNISQLILLFQTFTSELWILYGFNVSYCQYLVDHKYIIPPNNYIFF